MTTTDLYLKPLTVEAFTPFGDVIARHPDKRVQINEARFDRFTDLATVDTDNDPNAVNVSIMSCAKVSTLPYEIILLERHPHGSQAFVPLSHQPFVVVVAPPDPLPDANALSAFVTDGKQGVNLHRGVWHIPLIGFSDGQSFLVIDRKDNDNCDLHPLDTPIVLREGA